MFAVPFYPKLDVEMKPPGDGVIKLVKMLVAPIVLSTAPRSTHA
jgi:Na+/H+-dicarboxylate symporter